MKQELTPNDAPPFNAAQLTALQSRDLGRSAPSDSRSEFENPTISLCDGVPDVVESRSPRPSSPPVSDQFIRNAKKLLRTVQVHFPALLDAKFSAMRCYRNTLRRPFEYDFTALALFPAAPDALFLDVGANRGQSTDAILMNRRNARVLLFEPNEILFEKLEKIFRRQAGLKLHHHGLGDEAVESDLVVPVYKGWMFDGLGSFNKSEAEHWLRGRMFFYDERNLTLKKLKCRIIRLDDLGLNPFFIKLDIQGYEYKALRGAENTLKRYEPVLLVESPDDTTVEYLATLGYDFYAFVRGRFVQRTIGAPNTFFMTESKARLVRQHIQARSGPIVRL